MRLCQRRDPPPFELIEAHAANCWLQHPEAAGLPLA